MIYVLLKFLGDHAADCSLYDSSGQKFLALFNKLSFPDTVCFVLNNYTWDSPGFKNTHL